MELRSNIFSNIWLIVPFTPTVCNVLPSFLNKHQWFYTGGGNILFKSAASIDQKTARMITSAGCKLTQTEDSGIYEAWNQAMDTLEKQHLDIDAYVAFLGVDDEINEIFCLSVANLAKQSSKPDFIFGDAKYRLHDKCKTRHSPVNPRLFGKNDYLFDIPHPGLMNRWGTIRPFRFDLSYKLAADFDFYIGVAQSTLVSYQKIQAVQSTMGADGMSNSLEALDIYPREWSQIAARRQVHLAVPRLKIALFRKIARFPMIFHLLRRMAWQVRGRGD